MPSGNGADHPERNAELYKNVSGCKRPKRILEVGTAIGFSTLLMCEYGPEDLEIVTIENYEKRIPSQKRISGEPDGKRRLLCLRRRRTDIKRTGRFV